VERTVSLRHVGIGRSHARCFRYRDFCFVEQRGVTEAFGYLPTSDELAIDEGGAGPGSLNRF
jgi:hypothetical protein